MLTILFGSKGQLGRDLCARFSRDGEVFAADLPEVDIADFGAVEEFMREARPDLVINAAAYTDVEAAEDNPASAFRVNETGAGHIARASARAGAAVVYYSTDFVFDGTKRSPYVPEDAPTPLCVYATSKLAGEEATRENNDRHCIIRTAWLYGPGGNNFVEKIIRAAQTRPSLTVVEDEVGSPTYTFDLVEATAALASAGAVGTFHVVNSGSCSRYEFARTIVELAGLDTRVEPCSAEAFPMKAKRPLYSVLSNEKYEKLTGNTMRAWQEALAGYIQRRRQNQ
ncbi:MAG TPA: dTDP-4-dehydrorhamnose reductase [Candidatus Bathyarchaeia archaeon]|nr:dTDP-4-dehydrorhamnose reductase [Candidatus Bathyarchaeia archaeon]